MLNKNTASAAQVLKFDELVKLLDGKGSARFVTLIYRAKETGELARHTILLNVNRTRCLKVDLANLQKLLPTLEGVQAQACQELIDSITETLTTGQNSQYTKRGYYEAQGKGNVQVSVNDVCYVRGYTVGKIVIEEGTYKKVNSSPKTIAKNAIRKTLKNTKCREYRVSLENFVTARAEGKMILIDASATLNRLANLPPVTIAVPVAQPASA